MYEEYDYILVISSLGLPRNYVESYYVMEVERDNGRDTIPHELGRRPKKQTSIAAIIQILKEKLKVEKVKPLIFVQDTILLDEIVHKWSNYRDKEIPRKELMNILYNILYNSRPEAFRELGMYSLEDLKQYIVFVPGVLSYAEGSRLYTWRGERVYDLLRGAIILHVYEGLRKLYDELFSNDRVRLAIIIDTTHGINYFALALKEAVLIASELFALEKAPAIEILTVYHYNSDPLPSYDCEGGAFVPSLKLHLLEKINIVKDGLLHPSTLLSMLKEIEFEKDVLKNLWRVDDINWDESVTTLKLYSRGLLLWALKLASTIRVPELQRLKESFGKNLSIVFKESKLKEGVVTQFKMDYICNSRCPISHVVVSSILLGVLKGLASKICTRIEERVLDVIEDIRKVLDEKNESKNKNKDSLQELKNYLKRFINQRDTYTCFDFHKLKDLVKECIYQEPFKELIEHELEDNVEEYLAKRKLPGWREILIDNDLQIYKEPKGRPAYFILYRDNLSLLVSIPQNHLEKRHVYAHAALAYGLEWLAVSYMKNILLCLGDANKVKQIIRSVKALSLRWA